MSIYLDFLEGALVFTTAIASRFSISSGVAVVIGPNISLASCRSHDMYSAACLALICSAANVLVATALIRREHHDCREYSK